MRVIPLGADHDDLNWVGDFFALARALVEAGAKATLIEHFTGIDHRKVSRLYRSIHDAAPASGPLKQFSPKQFVTTSAKSTRSVLVTNIQAAAFVAIHTKLATAFGQPLNTGFHLLWAYRSYAAAVESGAWAGERNQLLDINRCYSLVGQIGGHRGCSTPEIATRCCPKCENVYLIWTDFELETQRCPFCRLAELELPISHSSSRQGMLEVIAQSA